MPVKIDLSGTATDPQTLAISGNALVTFQNKGDDKITTPFNILVFEDKDSDGKYTQGVDSMLATGITATANFGDEPLPVTILMITREYSPDTSLAGRIYQIERDGNIEWGPVYLYELMPETPATSYENAAITTDIDKEGQPVIGIRVDNKSVILDSDGYLKPPKTRSYHLR